MKFLKLPDVCEKVALGKSEIYARIKCSTFPAPVKIGAASRWLESDLDDWMAQIADSRAVPQIRAIA